MTIGDRLAHTEGRPSGFDYMRIILALLIVVWHTAVTAQGQDAQRALGLGFSRPVWAALVPMFFSLSGFLVAGSFERCRSLVSFLGLRLIRLVPALAVESALAVVVLGPLFTSLSTTAYFRNPETIHYLLNILGNIHYYLPGVFTNNPTDKINGQLWTLPAELKCYITISIIGCLGLYRRPAGLAVAIAFIQAYSAYRTANLPADINDVGVAPSSTLVMCFAYGVAFYRFRNLIPRSAPLFILCVVVSIILLSYDGWNLLSAPTVAYVTVYLGLLNPHRLSIFSSGDYSYGIFLYGFPIQQAVAAMLPGFRHWWVILLLATPLVCLFAFASWHLVEKRALRLRPLLGRLETLYLSAFDITLARPARAAANALTSRWAPARRAR